MSGKFLGKRDRPCKATIRATERVDVPDLIQTDKDINKVMTSLHSGDEVAESKQTAGLFYGPLLMFGEAAIDERDYYDGERRQNGQNASFFQDLGNFVDRLNSVTVNIIHHLSLQQSGFTYESTFRRYSLFLFTKVWGQYLGF